MDTEKENNGKKEELKIRNIGERRPNAKRKRCGREWKISCKAGTNESAYQQ